MRLLIVHKYRRSSEGRELAGRTVPIGNMQTAGWHITDIASIIFEICFNYIIDQEVSLKLPLQKEKLVTEISFAIDFEAELFVPGQVFNSASFNINR